MASDRKGRWSYYVEDVATGRRNDVTSMSAAKALAKKRSIETGQVMGIVAVDRRDGRRYAQGAFYGRTYQQGDYRPGAR